MKAAIVLSASVTFLSLPGLDNIARIPGLVGVLFATFSMVATVLAVFRYKADMERTISGAVGVVGGEGMVALSVSLKTCHSDNFTDVSRPSRRSFQTRNVVLSLPLVFLAYSVIAFVVGITLYSFRGMTETNSNVIGKHFAEYTRWTVVGVLGGFAGVLTTTLLVLRR